MTMMPDYLITHQFPTYFSQYLGARLQCHLRLFYKWVWGGINQGVVVGPLIMTLITFCHPHASVSSYNN
ncbi:hypothetical protein BDZ94DRAFT_1257369 [Collybia nuda]|uniref:Uncharacterized protein n=1 Tax=Collybia nuda TaxID=64659 RepID=A0A9P5Y895_9AGAR|nr:hypothetical protein BDZ94DRAFT_1257369 [Collybia nuda]